MNNNEEVTVTIEFSEYPELQEKPIIDKGFTFVNQIIQYLDKKVANLKFANEVLGYYKTYIIITGEINGELYEVEVRVDIGDGNIDLMDYIDSYFYHILNNKTLKNEEEIEYEEFIRHVNRYDLTDYK